MTTKKCYQCGDDDLAAIQAARREQIREFAAQQMEEADAAFVKEQDSAKQQTNEVSDWSILVAQVDDEQVVSFTSEPDDEGVVDATAATEPQENTALEMEVNEPQTPETQENDNSDDVANANDELMDKDDAETLVEKPKTHEKSATPKKSVYRK